MQDKRERLERAGQWLRTARRGAGYESAGDFARALGIDPSAISRYERGMSEVSDERAQQMADALGMSVIVVRRGLGMWTPSDLDIESTPALTQPIIEHLRQIERLAQEALAHLAPGEERTRGRASA